MKRWIWIISVAMVIILIGVVVLFAPGSIRENWEIGNSKEDPWLIPSVQQPLQMLSGMVGTTPGFEIMENFADMDNLPEDVRVTEGTDSVLVQKGIWSAEYALGEALTAVTCDGIVFDEFEFHENGLLKRAENISTLCFDTEGRIIVVDAVQRGEENGKPVRIATVWREDGYHTLYTLYDLHEEALEVGNAWYGEDGVLVCAVWKGEGEHQYYGTECRMIDAETFRDLLQQVTGITDGAADSVVK